MPSRVYRVEITERAARDLAYLYERVNADQSRAAARWFNRLEQAVHSLSKFPKRCHIAPEDRSLRCLLHGRKRDVYRVIFQVDEREKVVRILTIRQGAMDGIGEAS